MQNNPFHSYITPTNESAYRNVPDHLLDFPARHERGVARERERLEQERKTREAQEQFQKQQEANAKAMQSAWGSPHVYTPQYTPTSTPQPATRPQPQRQQPKRSVSPPARPSPSYSGSSTASQKASAWKRLGLFILFLVPTAIASASTPLHKNALALILATIALYQLVRFGGRVASLIGNDTDDDGSSAGHRCGWIFLSAAVIAGILYFGNVEANKTLANCVFYTGVFAAYQAVRLFFRVLKLMNEEL